MTGLAIWKLRDFFLIGILLLLRWCPRGLNRYRKTYLARFRIQGTSEPSLFADINRGRLVVSDAFDGEGYECTIPLLDLSVQHGKCSNKNCINIWKSGVSSRREPVRKSD